MRLPLQFRPHLERLSWYLVAELDGVVSSLQRWATTVERLTGRVTTRFDKVDARLSEIPGLKVNLRKGRTYDVLANVWFTADATGGTNVGLRGSATVTRAIYTIAVGNDASNNYALIDRKDALPGSSSQTTSTAGRIEIRGTVEVDTDGTLYVEFAQSTANNTSSVLIGSTLIVREL